MKDQGVLRIVTKWMIPFIMVFGFYVVTHGELGPGGGFQGGVILGSAFILYALVFGADHADKVVPRRVLDVTASLGVLIYAGVGTYCMLAGRAFLDYGAIAPLDPAGAESWGMTLVEYGVGITVAAVMIICFNEVARSGGRVARSNPIPDVQEMERLGHDFPPRPPSSIIPPKTS